MKFGLIAILLFVNLDLNDIARINSLKEKAEEAYNNGNYQAAFDSYKMLVDSFKVVDDNLLMNYANSAYFLTGLKDSKVSQNSQGGGDQGYADAAMSNYQKLTGSTSRELRSAAYNQIGVINYNLSNGVQKGEKYLNESLAYFKQSLKSNSLNDNARYNYEVVKKQLENQQNQDQQDQEDNQDNEEDNEQDQENQEQDQENQDQQNQDQDQQQEQQNQEQQEDQEQSDQQDQQQEEQSEQQEEQGEEQDQQQQQESQEGEQKEEEAKKSPSEKFEEMNISEEMAKMILEAMRNNEVQYIQQQKRKPTKRPDSSKPDW